MIEVLIGLVSGIVSGTGMGGGTILIFLLTFMNGLEQHVAQAANLIFFIPTSIIAIWVNIKNKNIDLKLGTIIIIFGIFGAIVGANLSIHTQVNQLKRYFGIFLAVIALHEIYTMLKQYKKQNFDNNKNRINSNKKG